MSDQNNPTVLAELTVAAARPVPGSVPGSVPNTGPDHVPEQAPLDAHGDSNDDRVRTVLARRIAGLLPTLDEATQTRLRRHVLSMLFRLVEDECVRVRAAIADVMKAMPEAPRELILRLAQDTEISVCEPVLLLSPLLTEADLLALLRQPPARETVTAIARRAGLTEALSDAIVATARTDAVGALLANPSAAIRETTLNALIHGAATRPEWQEPLVRRPKLSPESAAALTGIVTDRLLRLLASRDDLPPSTIDQLRRRLAERGAGAEDARLGGDLSASQAMQQAARLKAQGALHEIELQEALQRGEARYAAALLAVAADVPLAVVERAAALRSAKGLVSLVWKAGFSMQAATALQMLLARLPPSAVLAPAAGGGFPLMVAEMRWQLSFLDRLTHTG